MSYVTETEVLDLLGQEADFYGRDFDEDTVLDLLGEGEADWLQQATSGLQTGVSTYEAAKEMQKRLKRAGKRRKRRKAKPAPVAAAPAARAAPAGGGLPPWAIPVGAGVLILGGLSIYFGKKRRRRR